MAHHDFPASAFPDRPVPGVLTFPSQEPLHVTARLGVEPPYTDGTKPETWWADLNFHPFGPPAQDAECTLHFGGTIGRGRIAAGSTRMLGEGPPPTIRMAYVEDEGDPEMTARPEPGRATINSELIVRQEGPFVGLTPRAQVFIDPTAKSIPSGMGPHPMSAEPPHKPEPADWDRQIANGGDLLKDLQDAQHMLRQDDLIAHLGNITANLQAHIDQRAHELATPRIADVEERAAEQLAVAREEAGHWRDRFTDLQYEYRRQLQVADRRAVRAETAIARALATLALNTQLQAGNPGYQACADHVTTALNDTDQQEADHG